MSRTPNAQIVTNGMIEFFTALGLGHAEIKHAVHRMTYAMLTDDPGQALDELGRLVEEARGRL